MDLEIRNFYEDRISRGYSKESVMESIYQRGRDNARTPMQWSGEPNGGFTSGIPWLPVNPNYREINGEAEMSDPDSVFHYYQELIRLRKSYDVIPFGSFSLLDPENESVFAYERVLAGEHLLVVCNFTGREISWQVPETYRTARQLIGNCPESKTDLLQPFEAKMLYFKE